MKVIIFDLENVVIDSWHKIPDAVPELNALPKEILEEKLFSGPIQKEFFIGKITEEEFWQETLFSLNLKIGVEKLKKAVRSLMVELFGIRDLILQLKKHYKIVLLSNFPKEWFDYVNTRYNLNNLFDISFISGYTGVRKPEAEAYLQIIKSFVIEPKECIFVDDKEDKIYGAEEVGMKGILFTNILQLKRDLEEILDIKYNSYSHIFRAYDIRGKYPSEIDENFAFEIGKSFGTFNPGKVVVGMDVRTSGPSLKKKLIEGLISAGCEVVDIGVVTTPMTLFSTWFYNYDGGIMITASHNPKEFNGFLFNKKGGIPISKDSGLSKIKEIFDSKEYSEGKGSCVEKNIVEDYTNHVIGKIKIDRPLKVVIDAGNGTTGKIYPNVFRRLGIEVVELFCEPDGNFPNREPDPSKVEGLKHLQQKVMENGADLGFAFDCDGDRMGVVDENGRIIYVGVVFSIFINSMLSEAPSSKIVYTALDSNAIVDIIEKNNGVPVVCRVGHTFITEKMLETGAILSGELSGHYFFKDMNYADDNLFGSLKLIESLLKSGKRISDYENEFPKYYAEVSEKMRFPIRESEKFKFVDMIKTEFELNGHKVDTLDGVKAFFDNGWLMLRPANTEAKVSISYESRDKEEFEKMGQIVSQIVERIPSD